MRTTTVFVAITYLLSVTFVAASDLDAIKTLQRSGAIVERDETDDEAPASKVTLNLLSVTAEGIRAIKELEELPAIEFQGIGSSELGVSTLRALQGKSSLERFAIANAKISDDAAKILGTLSSLRALELRSQIEMSPAGFQHIAKLTNLKELALSDRLVSDAAIAGLTAFPGLKILSLRSVFITDAGLASLKRLQNLKTLRIFIGPQISEAGIRELMELQLTELEITYADITNDKLKSLRKFSGLKSMRFVNASGVTDDGIPSLSELTELNELDLSDAKLTKAGIAELKRALPKCNVQYLPIPRN